MWFIRRKPKPEYAVARIGSAQYVFEVHTGKFLAIVPDHAPIIWT